MSKNATLDGRLKKYSAVAGTIVAAGTAANAQIMYTNLDPDSVIDQNDSVYNLDLNNDLTVDFEIQAGFASGTYGGGFINYMADIVGVLTANNNEVAASAGSNGYYALALDFNDTIDENLTMYNINGTGANAGAMVAANIVVTGLYSTTIGAGNFIGQMDKFLGLKIYNGTDTLYGWARLDVAADAKQFTLKDYAIQSQSGMMILAGDDGMGGVGTAENGEDIMSMRFDRNNMIVNAHGATANGTVEIYDMAGKKVLEMNAQPGMNEYNLNSLMGGVYVVRANFANGQMVRKFMLR